MLFDLTKLLAVPYIEWIVLGVVALILIITLIITTSRGIVRCLFDLVYIGGFVAALLFGLPYIMGFLSATGFVETIQSKVAMLASIDASLVYMIIGVIAILVVFILVVKLLNLIFKGLFKTKGKSLVKFFGFIYGLIFFFVFSTFLLEVISSPFICKSGDDLIKSSEIVSVYKEKVTDPLQEVLHEQECVSIVEDYFLLKDNSIDSPEDLVAARESIANVRLLITDKAEYEKTLKNVGGFDNQKIENSIEDIHYFVTLVTSDSGFVTGKMAKSFTADFEAWVEYFDGTTPTVSNASKVADIADMLECSDEVKTQITTVFEN